MKSKGIAYLLWFLSFFGCFGFHRFYLRKYGTGILWFFTGGLLGLGSLIDLFTLGGKVELFNANNQLNTIRASTEATVKLSEANLAIQNAITKKCPFCAELIKTEAIVCRFCGRDLPKQIIHPTPNLESNNSESNPQMDLNFKKEINLEKDFKGYLKIINKPNVLRGLIISGALVIIIILLVNHCN